MSDNWPAPTPREEMLARVAARGTRIRAVRGAVNALVVLSVVGASALGVGAVIGDLGEGQGTEVENVAMVPEPPDNTAAPGQPTDEPGTTGSTGSTAGQSTTSSTGGSGSTSDGDDVASPGTGSTAGGGVSTPGSTGSTAPGSTAPGSSTTGSTQPPTTSGSSTTAPPAGGDDGSTTSTTSVPAPRVGPMKGKVDGGIPTGEALCVAPTAEIAVDIEGADHATVTWNRAGESRTAELTAESTSGTTEWSAQITEIDETAPDVPLWVVVTATGPGGTTHQSTTLEVVDC